MNLTEKTCKPCEGGIPKLTHMEIKKFNSLLKKHWEVIDDLKISKEFYFKDFSQTLRFVNKVAEIAENEGHHPVIHIYFAKAQIEIWTHAILGLSENDFILAAKIDELI
jgi:4a-hydroxytetrahydrobiopterin dehydratase